MPVWAKLAEVLVVVLLTSTAQLLLRFAMRNLGADNQTPAMLLRYLISTPALWGALACYGVSTLLWMRVLTRYPVGSVYPMVAVGYVLVTIGGVFFLGEKVPIQGWLALAVICFGTLFLAFVPWQTSN